MTQLIGGKTCLVSGRQQQSDSSWWQRNETKHSWRCWGLRQQYHEAWLRGVMWRSSSFLGCSVICKARMQPENLGVGATRPQQGRMVQHTCQIAGCAIAFRREPTLKTWLSANHCCLLFMLGPGLSLYCATTAATAALVSSMPIAWPMQAL